MIHKIETEVEVPAGWKPLGFAYIELGEHYLKNDGTVVKWVGSPKSNGPYLRVERVKWEPKNGYWVWTFDTVAGACDIYFQSDVHDHVALKEKGFLFETEAEAQHAYNETLTLMKKLKEEK